MRRGRRRGPQPLGPLAEGLLQRMDPDGSRHKARAVTAWTEIAGPDVGAHTRGFSLERGELTVFVDSNVWATELQAMSEDYRSKLNQALGEEAVGRLRFVVSRRVREGHEVQPLPAPALSGPVRAPRAPLDEAERAQIEHAAAGIQDESLRRAAVRAMVLDLERRKASRRSSRHKPPEDPENSL